MQAKRSVCRVLIVGLLAAMLVPASQAVVINDDYFAASGGDPADVFGTVDAGYSLARAYSFEDQFLAVGTIPGCTASWLGNDAGNNKTYVLTAAHCVEPNPASASSPITTTFTDWDGNGSGSLSGTVHLPPERYDPLQGCGGGACSDVAILELNGQISIDDANNQPIERPLVYDGDKEQGFENSFVGYGSWGIGSQGSNGGLFPASGPRRAGATNVIDGFFESSKGIGTDFDAPGTDNARPEESSVAPGDSGSGWWQQHLGHWTIIATTNGGSGTTYGTGSTGARVSQYNDWIQSIYTDVQLWSDTVLIGDINLDGVVDADLSGNDDFSAFIADWRQPSLPGEITIADLNEDRIVDLRDFYIFRQAVFNAGGGNISLPEPSALTLIGIGIWITVLVRRADSKRRMT